MKKARIISYWWTTTILGVVLGTGGVADILHVPATTDGVLALGYPSYFLTILGTWKVLGAIAILAPGFPRLKEWAYAGAFFNFSGAVISHLIDGSAFFHVLITTMLSIATMVSWANRPQSRRLGTTPPAARVFARATHDDAQLATAPS